MKTFGFNKKKIEFFLSSQLNSQPTFYLFFRRVSSKNQEINLIYSKICITGKQFLIENTRLHKVIKN